MLPKMNTRQKTDSTLKETSLNTFMRFIKFTVIAFSALIGLSCLQACKKVDTTNEQTFQEIIQTEVQKGDWKISLYATSGENRTSVFAEYTFNFGAEGTLTASSLTESFIGTWYVSDTNPDQEVLSDIRFGISYGQINKFEDLNAGWNVLSQSATKIELTHAVGGGEGSDNLTFEKL